MPKSFGIMFLVALMFWALFGLFVGRALASHVQCGDVITHDTTLDSDLVDCPRSGVVIGADNIALDLNGHTISGAGDRFDQERFGVDNTAGHDGVTVERGRIEHFHSGIRLEEAMANHLRGLTLVSNDRYGLVVWRSDRNRIEGNIASRNSTGIYVAFASHNLLRRNTMPDNDSIGMHLALADRNRITGNVGTHNTRGIVLSSSHENLIENHSESDNSFGLSGIGLFAANRNRVIGNTSFGVGQAGILVTGATGNLIAGNTVTANAYGIRLDRILGDAHHNVIRGNHASINYSEGITVTGSTHNRITDNDSSDNRGSGLLVQGSDNRVTRNTASDNVGPGLVLYGPRHLVARNAATGNMVGAIFDNAPDNTVERNVVSHNDQDGLRISGDSLGLLLRRNVANQNGDLGIEAIAGVIDGGRNRAAGNGNPLQCVSVACR